LEVGHCEISMLSNYRPVWGFGVKSVLGPADQRFWKECIEWMCGSIKLAREWPTSIEITERVTAVMKWKRKEGP